MVTDAWEPIDFLAEFRERETCLREVTELLNEKAQCETGKLWAHHLPLIVDALGFFQGLLQDEIDHFGEWRYHEFQPDESARLHRRRSRQIKPMALSND